MTFSYFTLYNVFAKYKGVLFMKKLIKTNLALLLALLLLFSIPSTALAYEYTTPDLQSMVIIQNNGNKESRFISGRDITRIKNSECAKYKNKSDKEKLKEIFEALDFNINEQQFEKISKTLNLSDIENIHISTSYMKMGKDGVQAEVSKAEALRASTEQNTTRLTPTTATAPFATASDTSPTASHSSPYETSKW